MNQIVKHSKPELWEEGADGKGGVPQRGGGGVADESEETDDSDTDGEGMGGGERKAAGHSSVLANMAGLRLPLESKPLQALVSEPDKPIKDRKRVC